MLEETSSSKPHEEEATDLAATTGEPPEADASPREGDEDGRADGLVEEASSSSEVTAAQRPERDRGRLYALGAMGALVAVGVGLIVTSPRKGASLPALALTSAELAVNGDAAKGEQGSASVPSVKAAARPAPVWRVAALKSDANVEVTEGTFGKNGLVKTLTRANVRRSEIRRLVQAFDGVHKIDRPSANDVFVIAMDKNEGKVVAFEYGTSPMDVWQARAEGPDGALVAKKLDLWVEHKRVAASVVVGDDLAKAIAAAGLRPEIVDAVGDALEVHVEPGAIRAGARMRVVTTEDWVEGSFARVTLEAVEFVPKSGSPLRVYYYERGPEVDDSPRRAPAPGWYDAKGRQPVRGAFRPPLAFARVTSRFNPKRMHPVLKVVMPHQGVDFGASMGTPVYASAEGRVINVGNGGPCGNMVEIAHAGGINTVYCHLKGFAQGLQSGQKVESRQLIGYVGQTGRVTGPHLHFGVKKRGIFIDPLSLKMDGVRVLPPPDRDVFARKRAELDAVIDGVALPSAADVPDENEDKDLHAD
jgi:murein DD-endopeptidase MepM/ murein hydrolase activator NlpD